MKSAAQLLLAATIVTAYVATPAALRAQAPPGPIHPKRTDADKSLPPPEEKKPLPRHDLWGNWTLNLQRSDDPRKKMQDPHSTRSAPVWGGYPGGRGGYPDSRGDPNDRDRTHAMIDPANSLLLARKDAEVDVTDDENHKRAFFTDGRKLQKSKDEKYKEQAARWDGPRLVTDEKGPWGMKLTRSFEISPNGQQLYETLAVDRTNSGGGFVMIRYVYDPAKEDAQSSTPAKPNSADEKPNSPDAKP